MRTDETMAIEREFPAWRIWLSRHRTCWAATLRIPTAGGDPTVIRDSAEDLCTALGEQAERMARRAREHDWPGTWS
jgi:hypothetical protein